MGNNRVQDSGAREQLRPCPFCGGEANIYQMHFWGTTYTCECSDCGIETKPMDTEAEAIEAWNRRVATDKNVGDKERMAKVVCNGTTMGLSFCCGNCGKPVHSEGKYCHHCGVKLDWSE